MDKLKQWWRLRSLCTDQEMFESALEYCRESTWSVHAMIEYVTGTGMLPPPEVASYPDEVLALMRSSALCSDDSYEHELIDYFDYFEEFQTGGIVEGPPEGLIGYSGFGSGFAPLESEWVDYADLETDQELDPEWVESWAESIESMWDNADEIIRNFEKAFESLFHWSVYEYRVKPDNLTTAEWHSMFNAAALAVNGYGRQVN